MNPKQFKAAIARQCGFNDLSGGSNAGKPSNAERDVKKLEMGTNQRTNPSPAQSLTNDDIDQFYAEEQARRQPDQPNGIRGLPANEQTEETI